MEAELKRLNDKLTKEVLWLYILGALLEKPVHAYALRKKIAEKFGFTPGQVTAYVVLYKLESRGFVTSKQDKNKKTYFVSPKGKKLLSEAKKIFLQTEKQVFG